jgi:hypothetical protein
VLDSIWWALGGEKCIQEIPIRQGEKSASITLDLGEMKVTRNFTAGGSYLKVETEKGARYPSPQSLLDKLVGKLSFDPLAFAKADKAKQIQTLLGVVDLQIDPKKLGEIAGIKVMGQSDPLKTLKGAQDMVFNQRALVNRDLSREKKLLESIPEVEKVEPVSLTALMEEKERLSKENLANSIERVALESLEEDASEAEIEIANVENQIKKLQKELVDKKAELELTQEELEWKKTEVSKLKDHDLTDVNDRIKNADETNKSAAAYAQRQEHETALAEYQKESTALTARLNTIKAYKEELIRNSQFPVEGLDFGDNGILYQGLPFEQASSAQKLQVSLAIAMALNPELRVIRIDDASLLDSDHMKIIEEMAKEKDFQVWMEVVDESGKVGIYIEDGAVVTVNGGEQSA